MILLSIQQAQAVILLVVAVIIFILVILSIRKWGIKSIFYWIVAGLLAYLFISDAILS